jgi:hypothetical protein
VLDGSTLHGQATLGFRPLRLPKSLQVDQRPELHQFRFDLDQLSALARKTWVPAKRAGAWRTGEIARFSSGIQVRSPLRAGPRFTDELSRPQTSSANNQPGSDARLGFGPSEVTTTPIADPSFAKIGEPDIPPTTGFVCFPKQSAPRLMTRCSFASPVDRWVLDDLLASHEISVQLPSLRIGFSAADEIEKLDRLKKAGSISEAEFVRLRAKSV